MKQKFVRIFSGVMVAVLLISLVFNGVSVSGAGGKEKSLQEWDSLIKQQSLDLKFDSQLVEILKASTEKIVRVQKDLNEFRLFPEAKKGEIYKQFTALGEIKAEPDNAVSLSIANRTKIDVEFQSQLQFYVDKVERLQNYCALIVKEQELRATKQVVRTPEGTTYYVDYTNGTDTFTGTKLTGTIDSTADTTHFVDSDLTGADDYILNSYFYNVTTGKGTKISSFVALTDTVTLTDADAAMAIGDTYYIYAAWKTLTKVGTTLAFGDTAIVRRNRTQTVTADVVFTNDGTIVAPIKVEGDYDDAWKDHTDIHGTGTATLTFGSKTVTFSADISGVLAAGDWIYVSGDNIRDFSYEVAFVVTTTVTLYLPYKGGQAGAGRTVFNIHPNPIWNTAEGTYEVNLDADNYWKFQGLHFRGSDSEGVVEIDSCSGHVFKDCIFEGNGTNDVGLYSTDDVFVGEVLKCRFYNYVRGLVTLIGASSLWCIVKDCLFNGNNVASSYGICTVGLGYPYVENTEFKNHGSGDIGCYTADGFFNSRLRGRNLLLSSATKIDLHDTVQFSKIYIEDYGQVIGDNRQLTGFSVAEGTPSIQSDTTDVRAGGGATSIKVTPSIKLGTAWELSKIQLFEYPIYAVKDVEKTYTVYFKSDDDTDWHADPLNTELWIEAEYWGHGTNVARKITKSTGVCDNFNADDTVWDTLTVTVTPLQTGVLYLRGFYCRLKDTGHSNIFFCDTED